MAIEQIGAVLKKMAETTVKEGLKKGLDGLKDGKSFSESLKGGFDKMKETGFKEIEKFLTPENAEKLNDVSNELNELQEKIEFSPEEVVENQNEALNQLNKATNEINEVAKDLNENLGDEGLSDEIKLELDKFKDILDQVKEIQEKLKEIGISPDLLSMLNDSANEIDEMEEAIE